MQLSTLTDAFLFRINKIGLPEKLIKILTDKSVLKIGVAIDDDIKTLNKISKFKAQGFVDLSKFSEIFDIEANGLKKLVAIVLESRISKSQQLSNWESEKLTLPQEIYASTDAWTSLLIYNKLNSIQI